jgi:hypothetical protein
MIEVIDDDYGIDYFELDDDDYYYYDGIYVDILDIPY